MEGLEVLAPSLHDWVVPLSLVVLVGLFAVQRFGTAVIGRAFGPVIVLWFVVLAVSGLPPALLELEQAFGLARAPRRARSA